MRFLFVLAVIFILIVFCRKCSARYHFFRLRNKIKNNPFIGLKQEDGSYKYKEGAYAVDYLIRESCAGYSAKWLSFKRRMTFIEKKILGIKIFLDKFILYQKWAALLRPPLLIVLLAAFMIFYFGIKDRPEHRIERFKWIVAQMAGISPETVGYQGSGWFKISGQRKSASGDVEPVKISFNLLNWLFFPDKTRVSFWNKRQKRYIDYSMDINDSGDVWLDKKTQQIHGRVLADKIVWDQPQRAGIRSRVSSHRFSVQDGKLNISDE